MTKNFFIAICFVWGTLLAQENLQDYLTITILDSIAQEDYSSGWYTGYSDVHLATNGENLYLAAKKMYNNDSSQAWADVLLGTRQGIGRWNFEVVGSYTDKIYHQPLNIILMHNVTPIIFYGDRTEQNVANYVLKYTSLTGTGWVETLFCSDPEATAPDWIDWLNEYYQDGFNLSTDENGVTAYWWRTVVDTIIYDAFGTKVLYRPLVVGKNWTSDTTFTVVDLPRIYGRGSKPVVTKDGEYLAFSFYVRHPDHSYWGVYVFRKTANGYVKDFADSTISDNWDYDYLNRYSLAMGKKGNGDILLLAKGPLGNPLFLKANGRWSKIMDQYPTRSGGNIEASTRDPANERILFANDGTAFWGDFDGYSTGFFSAEISYYTPEGDFGHLLLPAPDFYPDGGIFQYHDFTITSDDTLHFVYEFQPWAQHPKCLVEGKIYVPNLLRVTGIEKEERFLPSSLALYQNFPNPFNPTTAIRFDVPRAAHVSLKIFDVTGREIATLVDEPKTPGSYRVTFDASDLASGIYVYQLITGRTIQSRKMILLK